MHIDSSQTLPDFIQLMLKNYAENDAFTCMGQTLSYQEIDVLSNQFASYLQNHTNLMPGDRVAVQLPNVLQYPVVVFGIFRAGMTVVNTNPLYTKRELKHQLNDSGAKALIVLANIAETAASVVADTTVEKVIVTELADLHGPVKRILINSLVKYVKKLVPKVSFADQVSLREALSLGAQKNVFSVVVQPSDVAVLQYTGGTTGVAKGAMLMHSNLIANMRQLEERLEKHIDEGKEVYVAPLPLYHIYAFMMHCLSLMASGSHSVLIPNPRDLDSFAKAMKPFKVTGFVGLNTLFNGLCNNESFQSLDFSHLKLTASGGMALTSDTADLWEKMTGCVAGEGYGMTETSPVVSFNPADDIRAGTVGTAVFDTEVKVVDEEGNEQPVGESGELLVRGPQVMKGYWQRPEATAEMLSEDGWLDTGDMATIDSDGYIKIVDRKKDMIIVSGFNVYPNEIEDEVTKHPGILEAAVIGVPNEKTGEAVKMFVVKSDPALTAKDIIAFCRESLTAYKVPREVVFREDLPKTNVGKTLRRELRDT